jgi:hypothetical protein
LVVGLVVVGLRATFEMLKNSVVVVVAKRCVRLMYVQNIWRCVMSCAGDVAWV